MICKCFLNVQATNLDQITCISMFAYAKMTSKICIGTNYMAYISNTYTFRYCHRQTGFTKMYLGTTFLAGFLLLLLSIITHLSNVSVYCPDSTEIMRPQERQLWGEDLIQAILAIFVPGCT